MFAYRAQHLHGAARLAAAEHVAVVDTLTAPVAGLGRLLGVDGPTKIVHDVAFDARLLAECGVELGNVHDTAIAAHMLGARRRVWRRSWPRSSGSTSPRGCSTTIPVRPDAVRDRAGSS